MSIDKITKKDINNSYNLYLQILTINCDMFISNLNNMKLMWEEFWNIWLENTKEKPIL